MKLRDLLQKLLGRRGADVRSGDYVSNRRHIILGGCGRSGTTLARVILDSHPSICCGPESKVFLPGKLQLSRLRHRFDLDAARLGEAYAASRSRAEFIDRFAELCCEVTRKSRWAEKTPRNVLHLDYVFARFPEVRFVHLLRDGRDVACSLRTHPRHRVVNGKLVPVNTWRPIQECAARWRDSLLAVKPFLSDRRVHTLRYENLVGEPRATIGKLLEFLEEPWDERVLSHAEVGSGYRDPTKFPQNPEALRPIETKALRRWQHDMSVNDRKIFKQIAGDLLIEQGYATDYDW